MSICYRRCHKALIKVTKSPLIIGSPRVKCQFISGMTAFLFPSFSTVNPQLIKVPDRFLLIEEGSTATVTCEAFSYPPSVIT